MKIERMNLTAEQVTLTAYLLDESEEMENAKVRPAVLVCPGGGYQMCSDREAEPVAMAFLAEGYHAFVLRYSLNEQARFPQPLRDAEEALALIRMRAEEWNVNPEKIAACGFSAGGHLAACLGTMGKERPNAMILGYPVIRHIPGPVLPYEIPSAAEAVDAMTPPAFLFAAQNDIVVSVEHSLSFASALSANQIPFALHIFQNGGHGFALSKGMTGSGKKTMLDPETRKWFPLCIAWLEELGFGFPAESADDLIEKTGGYSVDLPFGILWKNPACREMIVSLMPQMENVPGLDSITDVSFRKMLGYSQDLPEGMIDQIDEKLRHIPIENS